MLSRKISTEDYRKSYVKLRSFKDLIVRLSARLLRQQIFSISDVSTWVVVSSILKRTNYQSSMAYRLLTNHFKTTDTSIVSYRKQQYIWINRIVLKKSFGSWTSKKKGKTKTDSFGQETTGWKMRFLSERPSQLISRIMNITCIIGICCHNGHNRHSCDNERNGHCEKDCYNAYSRHDYLSGYNAPY